MKRQGKGQGKTKNASVSDIERAEVLIMEFVTDLEKSKLQVTPVSLSKLMEFASIISNLAAKKRAMARRAKTPTSTDWEKAAAITDAELEASVAADPDEAGMVVDWDNATAEMPKR